MKKTSAVGSFGILLCLLVLTVTGPQQLFADSISPGQTIAPSGTSFAADSTLGGTEIADQTLNFSFEDTSTQTTDSGTLFDAVIKESGSGTLDFVYAVSVDPSATKVGAIRTSGFGTGPLDVNYRTDSIGTVDPTEIERFSGGESGDINFSFGSPVLAGESSQFSFIRTSATAFDTLGQTDISADYGAGEEGISFDFSTYEPEIPEPSGWTLLACGLASLLIFRGIRQYAGML